MEVTYWNEALLPHHRCIGQQEGCLTQPEQGMAKNRGCGCNREERGEPNIWDTNMLAACFDGHCARKGLRGGE